MNDLSTITRLHVAPSIRFEPCLAFATGDGRDLDVCDGCGWSVEDHEPAHAA
jgi:hypothetical protein